MLKFFANLMLLAGLIGFIYGCWCLERWVHYRWGYQSMVEQTVRQMVKPEALKAKP